MYACAQACRAVREAREARAASPAMDARRSPDADDTYSTYDTFLFIFSFFSFTLPYIFDQQYNRYRVSVSITSQEHKSPLQGICCIKNIKNQLFNIGIYIHLSNVRIYTIHCKANERTMGQTNSSTFIPPLQYN
jgi:hypothetical protein